MDNLHLVCVSNFPVRDEEHLTRHSRRRRLLKDGFEWIENLRSPHVGRHGRLKLQSLIERLLGVSLASVGKKKSELVPEGDDVEGATDRKGFEEQEQRLFGGLDPASAHGFGSVHDEDEFGLLQFGALDGAEVGEEVERDDVLTQKSGSLVIAAAGRENGDRLHLSVISDLEAEVVIEFMLCDLDRCQFLGPVG